MKKLFALSVLISLISGNLLSQIEFDHSFNYSASSVKLENAGTKYFLLDVPAEQCRLYDPDYSLWKTIQYNIPNNQYIEDIKYVSQHLFNSDDLVETLITYYDYITTQSSYYYVYTAEVVNENGSVLLSVPGGSYAEVKTLPDGGSNLFVYVYDYSVWPYTVETKIYRIPGQPLGKPETEFTVLSENKNALSLYPNPGSGHFKISMDPQLANYDARLVVRSSTGGVVYENHLKNQAIEQQLDLVHLPSGVYYYELISKELTIKPTKFIIAR